MTSPLRIKICGITKPDQGRAIARMGATAVGFICFPKSPRYVTPQQIRAIVDALPSETIDRVGVFVDAPVEEIVGVVAIGHLNAVQLHGNESPDFCEQIRSVLPGVEVIKAVRVRSQEALEQALLYSKSVDALLLDAYHPNLYGGTGKTLDWAMLQHFCPGCSWFLSGGLTPDNVRDALSLLHPDGIDLSSGVEIAPGDKDLAAVQRLFDQLSH
jgi:phosphoribosylanthranilate isomerase